MTERGRSKPGPSQTWDPRRYERSAAFVPALGEPVVELLAPRSGERILDLGCGDGVLTEKLIAAGAEVVGADMSSEQVAAARARGIDAHVIDGHEIRFDRAFDAVFSNAALHWMRDPDRVLTGIHAALRPGGRFVGEFGGAGNCAAVRGALYDVFTGLGHDPASADPWYFPELHEYRNKLAAHGFRVRTATLFPRPTPIPGPIEDWLDTFAGSFLDLAPAGARNEVKRLVGERLKPKLCDQDGKWTVDYVRLRFAAFLPG